MLADFNRKHLQIVTVSSSGHFWSQSYKTWVHNSILMAGRKFFSTIPKGQMICFYPFKEFVYKENMLKAQNFGLSGPNQKLPRATFGPQAVCCACLYIFKSKKDIISCRLVYDFLLQFRINCCSVTILIEVKHREGN